ncbi:MAG: lysylphosphatidylglycerol synthase transmembrane domain-containing protein [Bdellovibrionota bacterium]
MKLDKKVADRLKFALKLIVGLGLVVYVLRSNMVDFAALGEVVFKPVNLGLSLVAYTLMTVVIVSRWHLLVRAQGLSLSFKELFSLTMIGNFFNTFMPGSVGGDLIKAWYVAGQEPQRKTKAIFTVLLDRVIGLTIIVFSAAATLLIFNEWLVGRPELKLLAYSLWAFTGATLLFGGLFFLSTRVKISQVSRLMEFFRGVKFVGKILDALLLYRNELPTMFKAVVLSFMNVMLLSSLWAIHGMAMGIDITLAHYFFIVPVGLTVSAIPLLPGGIGVGQVAFFTLFSWLGVQNPEQGGTLCTLLQVHLILFNCLGSYFYLRFKSAARPDKKPQSGGSPGGNLYSAKHA